MNNFPYKVGDRIRIVKKTLLWDSSLGGEYPWYWDAIFLGDIVTIVSIDSGQIYTCFNGVKENDVYGFLYSDDTKDCYELVGKESFFIPVVFGMKKIKNKTVLIYPK